MYGIAQLYRAYATKFERLNFSTFDAPTRRWTCHACRFGVGARGVVFGIIGTFLIVAAVTSSPSEARGLGGAMNALRSQPYGALLLGIVALGLMAYGGFQFISARYRRITPPSTQSGVAACR